MEDDLINEFLEKLKGNGLSKETVIAKKYYLSSFTKWCDNKGIDSYFDIDNEIVRQFSLSLSQSAKKTVYDKVFAIFSFYEWLIESGRAILNPCKKPSAKKDYKHRIVPSATAIDAFYSVMFCADTPIEKRNFLIMDVIISCGLRRAEIHLLNVNNVNFDTLLLKVKGKGGKERKVPIHEGLAQDLEYYIKEVRPHFIRWSSNALFLSKKTGLRLCKGAIDVLVQEIVLKYQLSKDITPHALRHYFAISLLRNNCPIDVLAQLLGHSKIETTQIYTRLLPTDLIEHYSQHHPRC